MNFRPFSTAKASPPKPLGDLIQAAFSAVAEEEKAKAAYRAGIAQRAAIDVTARKALEAENAVWRRLREIAPEEFGS